MEKKDSAGRMWDVAVIGGGPAGLAAAAFAARAGKSVVLFEKAAGFGGRSASVIESGAVLNLGAHALYRGGSAQHVLEQLGVETPGKGPGPNIHWVPGEGRGDIVSTAGLLLGRALTWAEKRRFLRFFLGLRRIDPKKAEGMGWTSWLAENGLTGRAAAVAEAMARVSSYAGDVDRIDAGTVLRQLQKPGVIYPDGGWQTFVDGLAVKAALAGAECRTSASVAGVDCPEGIGGAGWIVRLADGEAVRTRTIIAAVEPLRVAGWFEPWLSADYARSLRELEPVYVSSLDLHLRRLPDPGRPFALGLDQPLYFSAHSQWARLCDHPEHAVVHAMRYDGGKKGDPSASRAELEAFLDRLQPGWRDVVERVRFLPHVVVTYGMPSYGRKGAAGRPAIDTGAGGVYVAGDWAGTEDMLLDAALHSAREAARLAVQQQGKGVNVS
ncbi:FAD-dependent oxidoreductase [Cohnella sp. CFH 77786]|uniref:FAD-dependent oxidoreductase n=1 Tax=Cohnella sp. CFH 77786 TaxID=2662265 RepID=UPI001C6091EC|nr:FAD-dependent oxidoreductase [Cohnella sp. CFH 77786]MBW5447468.1 FAD-dependent oxidoreductase [Cohnella sp. CFH 77786]